MKHTLEFCGYIFPVLFTKPIGDVSKLPEEGEYEELMESGYCDEGQIVTFMMVDNIYLDDKEVDVEDISIVMLTDYLRNGVGLEEPFYSVQGNEENDRVCYEIEIEGDIDLSKIKIGIIANEVSDYCDHLVCRQVWYDDVLLEPVDAFEDNFDDFTMRLYDFDISDDDEE